MTIEISIIIAALSLAFAVYFGVQNHRISSKKEISKDASSLTMVIVKLENIGNDISEMKTDLRDVKNDVKEHSMDIATLKQQVKALEKVVFSRDKEGEMHEKINY